MAGLTQAADDRPLPPPAGGAPTVDMAGRVGSAKRRIAFHFFSMAQGGVERMRIALAGELLARGFAVDFVLCQASGELLSLVPEGVRIIDLKAARSLGSIAPLVRYLRNDAPDAMFASLGHQNVAAIAAKAIARSPVWLGVMQHNALTEESNSGISLQHTLLPLAYRCTLRGADKVLTVSKGVADDLAAATGYPRARISVIYNPACPTGIDEIIAAERPEHRFFGAGAKVVIGVGRLTPQKGFNTLLRAFARLAATQPARLIICGVGPDEAALKALASTLGIADHVDFVGFQKFPIAWIAAGDLLVLSSRYEGFGNVLVEGLAAGTPIVSTDCDYGPSEILENGRYGTLVPVDDDAAMADAMLAALAKHPDAERLRARAHDFSIARIADRYLAEAFGSPA